MCEMSITHIQPLQHIEFFLEEHIVIVNVKLIPEWMWNWSLNLLKGTILGIPEWSCRYSSVVLQNNIQIVGSSLVGNAKKTHFFNAYWR